MIAIEDKIVEVSILAAKFAPITMTKAEREDLHKLALTVRDILVWIKEHEGAIDH